MIAAAPGDRRLLPALWYPLTSGIAILSFALLLRAGAPVAVALYVPVLLVLGAVLILERLHPARQEWRPDGGVIRADLAFMATIQVLLPRALAILLVLALTAARHEAAPSSAWPHAWPLWAQVVLMVLAVDFLRYWFHRACHSFTPLWRLHEVHHSPELLYSLNTARFHPLEKAGHFLLDTVPFVLLGVSGPVLAGYLLAYSVNGIWQHCNVRLRYGWLNYVVASAETHRWHHARDPRVANCNFGNTTIVWDLIFGSFHLPGSEVGEVGIPDRSYPRGFVAQMTAPFRQGGPWRAMKEAVAGVSLRTLLAWTWFRESRRIAAALADPMLPQRRLLAEILSSNRDTAFGREHEFAEIGGPEEFQARVPVRDYEALRPWVEAQRDRGEKSLTSEDPVTWLRTSGTTGQPKDIPLTQSHRKALDRINALALAAQHRLTPQAFSGHVLAITTPSREGVLECGKPWGSASGAVSEGAPRLVREKFVLPPAVLAIADSRLRYLVILRLALAQRRITYIATANASTLLTLMRVFREEESRLLADLREGGFFRAGDLDPALLSSLRPRLKAAPWRADEIESRRRPARDLRIADLWPELALVVVWTRSSAGLAARSLATELGPGTRIAELGYLSSEFRGTVTLGRRPESGLPTFDTHFFEFVERQRQESGEPRYLTLDELERGGEYYIVVTTPSGLYRYFMDDIVRVTGHLGRMPLIEFVQKGRGVTSITGEKLSESQVLAAVSQVLAELGMTSRFVMMLADEAAARYRLHVEPDGEPAVTAAALGALVDERLMELNVEYRGKRASLRLEPVEAAWLEAGAGEACKRERVAAGQREAQFKLVALARLGDFPFDLRPWSRP